MSHRGPRSTHPESRRRYCRGWNRSKRHGNWRQLMVDQDGLCACGELIDHLHEPFGENNSTMQARIGQCILCHGKEHEDEYPPMSQFRFIQPSKIIQDTLAEMKACGSFLSWCDKYRVTPKNGVFSKILWPDVNGEAQMEMVH